MLIYGKPKNNHSLKNGNIFKIKLKIFRKIRNVFLIKVKEQL